MKCIKYNYIWIVAIISFLSAQRFLFQDLSPYFFILLYPIIFIEKDLSKKYSLFLLSIFLMTDNGGADFFYNETHFVFKYFAIIYPILFLILITKINLKKALVTIPIIVIYFIITISNDQTFDHNTLSRSIQILIFIILFFSISKKIEFNYHLLALGILPFLLSEFINYVFFHDLYEREYLSYHSLKTLVVFPLFYFSTKLQSLKNFIFFLIILCITLIVVIEYRQRMMIVVLFLALILSFLRKINLKYLFLSIIVVLLIPFDYDFLIGNKSTALIIQILESNSLNNLIQTLDPVRYIEYKLFFGRDFFSLILGDGLASGLFDSGGELIVSYDSTAFSESEINSSTYYNLHETIPDLGLRFGLLFILILLFRIIQGLIKLDYLKYTLLLFLFFCSLWSINGIVAFFLIYNSKNNSLYYQNHIT